RGSKLQANFLDVEIHGFNCVPAAISHMMKLTQHKPSLDSLKNENRSSSLLPNLITHAANPLIKRHTDGL
ncbi:hypothetical protein, partial [Xanthomonas hortorum]|uniref:hypothetical protein n=1 Tax=Xanthomonas hortorum TaxID=56454 RepID=UPI0020447FD8